MKYIQNAAKPVGLGGKMFIRHMQTNHVPLSAWGFTYINLNEDFNCLDIGCGGGYNIGKLLEKCPQGKVTGVDYSSLSVSKSKQYNKKAIKEGRCRVLEANVLALPFEDNTFDAITAFETVYYWPNIVDAFKQVRRVLKEGGTFMICNEADGTNAEQNKVADIIKGMKMYTEEDFAKYLLEAGFTDISTETNENNWIVVIAKK